MIRSISILLISAVLSAAAASAPIEVWLTPERAASLKRVTSRPYIVAQDRLAADTVVYHWTNSVPTVTTQKVQRVLGAPSRNAWQDKLDAKDREKQTLLDDIKAVKDKPTKKSLEDIISKHSK